MFKSTRKPAARPGSPRGLYTLAVGSILGRGGADVRTTYTEAAAAVQDCGSRGAWPASLSLSFPLAGRGYCGRLCGSLPSAAANICACCLPRRGAVCPSFPTSLQLFILPSPRDGHSNGCADCRQMFGMLSHLSRYGTADTSSSGPGQLDLQTSDGSQVCPALRKPSKEQSPTFRKRTPVGKVTLHCRVTILTSLIISFLCWF